MDTPEKTRTRTFAGRGLCAECATELTLIAGGLVIAHGPRDARCPGGGRPPRPSEPVAEASPTDDTSTEPSAAVEPVSAPVRYQEGDRVRSGDLLGSVEAVYGSTIEVTWDDGRAQTRGADSIERVGRPEAEPVAESVALASWTQTVARVSVEAANEAPTDGQFVHTYTAGPTYTRLDEDDGEIDGGAVTPRAETSHADLPAEDGPECKHHRAATAFAAYLGGLLKSLDEQPVKWVTMDDAWDDGRDHGARIHRRLTGGALPEPSLLSMAQRSRIEQLEADAARRLPDGEAQRRRIAVLEDQLDASREEVAALTRRLTDALAERDILSREAAASAADARRSRDTLRGALDLIGRLGPA